MNKSISAADYEALSRGCLSETASKEAYLAERNALASERDDLLAALKVAVHALTQASTSLICVGQMTDGEEAQRQANYLRALIASVA